jgi:hypothetical protein
MQSLRDKKLGAALHTNLLLKHKQVYRMSAMNAVLFIEGVAGISTTGHWSSQ